MRYLLTILFLLILFNEVFGQLVGNYESSGINLVANGSFEDRNICVENKSGCAPEAWFYLPFVNGQKQELSHTPKVIDGRYYVDLTVPTKNSPAVYHSYLYTKLLCPLQKNATFNVSMWIYTFKNQFSNLAVMLSDFEPQTEEGQVKNFSPTFILNENSVTNIKGGWKRVNFLFTADGNEKFFTIGVTKSKEKEKYAPVTEEGDVLYLLDNICLTPTDRHFKKCSGYNAIGQQLYDQNFRHTAFHPVSNIKLKPSLFEGNTVTDSLDRKRDITWVIVDTPPAFKTKDADTLTISDILFHFNSSVINQSFRKKLDSVIDLVKGKKFQTIIITGYTDSLGTTKHNEQLSYQRAITIKQYLLSKISIDEKVIKANGAGERLPVASNKTAIGRQKNRRVEIVLKL